MKHLLYASILFLIFQQVQSNQERFLSSNNTDQLLFVFEVTRHGARNGLHYDFYNTTWLEGELTNVGARQHYLIGRQLRHKYIDQMQYLSPQYDPRQIFIRSTCTNRTIESAYSQLLGLYPPSSNNLTLNQEQRQATKPPFNVSDELRDAVNSELKENALPYGFVPVPVHSFTCENDYFQPYGLCPAIHEIRLQREHDQTHEDFMNTKFNQTLAKLAQALDLDKSTFKAHIAVQYIDSLWARHFEQDPLSKSLTSDLLNETMDLYFEYYNYTLAMNETNRRAYLTGLLSEFLDRSADIIELDLQNNLTIDIWKKFFFYSDHDDSIVSLADAFQHHLCLYPPFASVIVFELWRKNQDYYVNVTINDMQVHLKGKCQGQMECQFNDFQDLISNISFYGDEVGYQEVCGQTNDVFYFYQFNLEDVFADDDSLYSERRGKYFPDYSRFIIAYCINLSLAIIGYLVITRLYKARRSQY